MTKQEAIKELERHIQFLRENWKPHPDYKVIETLGMAINALEKQIPKKPIPVDSGVYDYKCDYECPNCRKNVDDIEHHCECGQRLDWEDSEV